MIKTIIVRESYDWITDQDISAVQMEELIRYIEEKYPGEFILEQRYRKVRFINFVGVIQCTDVRYEILPKINLSKEDERKALVSMLTAANFLPISFYEKVKNGTGKSDLLSALLAAFIEMLMTELSKGVYKTYEIKTENLNVLKGRLEVSQHFRKNAFQKTRAYCSFDEHTENNLLNQLFKAALMIIRKNMQLTSLRLPFERCLGYLEYVDLVQFNKTLLEQVSFNRQNERFKDVALFARLIIEHASIYSHGQSSTAFSFLFPMNLLFEKYIEAALRVAVGYNNVISQHAQQYLLKNQKTGRKSILMKPDFIVGETIIDTKWKSASFNGRFQYNQADVYQMYAYVTSYEDAKRCILLYPKQEEEPDFPIWEVKTNTEKTIEMRTVSIDQFHETVNELQEILEERKNSFYKD